MLHPFGEFFRAKSPAGLPPEDLGESPRRLVRIRPDFFKARGSGINTAQRKALGGFPVYFRTSLRAKPARIL